VLVAAVTNLINVDRAIVFVDRPELSADERRIAEWAGALQGLGRDVQLIFATSSASLLASIDPRCIIEVGRGAV
jgi:predicted ATPase